MSKPTHTPYFSVIDHSIFIPTALENEILFPTIFLDMTMVFGGSLKGSWWRTNDFTCNWWFFGKFCQTWLVRTIVKYAMQFQCYNNLFLSFSQHNNRYESNSNYSSSVIVSGISALNFLKCERGFMILFLLSQLTLRDHYML